MPVIASVFPYQGIDYLFLVSCKSGFLRVIFIISIPLSGGEIPWDLSSFLLEMTNILEENKYTIRKPPARNLEVYHDQTIKVRIPLVIDKQQKLLMHLFWEWVKQRIVLL